MGNTEAGQTDRRHNPFFTNLYRPLTFLSRNRRYAYRHIREPNLFIPAGVGLKEPRILIWRLSLWLCWFLLSFCVLRSTLGRPLRPAWTRSASTQLWDAEWATLAIQQQNKAS